MCGEVILLRKKRQGMAYCSMPHSILMRFVSQHSVDFKKCVVVVTGKYKDVASVINEVSLQFDEITSIISVLLVHRIKLQVF